MSFGHQHYNSSSASRLHVTHSEKFHHCLSLSWYLGFCDENSPHTGLHWECHPSPIVARLIQGGTLATQKNHGAIAPEMRAHNLWATSNSYFNLAILSCLWQLQVCPQECCSLQKTLSQSKADSQQMQEFIPPGLLRPPQTSKSVLGLMWPRLSSLPAVSGDICSCFPAFLVGNFDLSTRKHTRIIPALLFKKPSSIDIIFLLIGK